MKTADFASFEYKLFIKYFSRKTAVPYYVKNA